MPLIRIKQNEFPEFSYNIPRALKFSNIYQMELKGPFTVSIPDGRKDLPVISDTKGCTNNMHVVHDSGFYRVRPLNRILHQRVYDVHYSGTEMTLYRVRPYSWITYKFKRDSEDDIEKWSISTRSGGDRLGEEMSPKELYGIFMVGIFVHEFRTYHENKERIVYDEFLEVSGLDDPFDYNPGPWTPGFLGLQ